MDTPTQTSQIPFVDLKAQYSAIVDEVNAAISTVLERTDFILGESVSMFEEEFAAYCEASYAVGLDSGTSALELALRAFDIGSGDEVITAANTFIATALAISYTGARVVLVDVDPSTYTIDPAEVEKAITPRTKAIIPVHLYGQPADMEPIMQIADRHGLVVIEDACQAHGAKYKGKRVGSIGHAAAFSFYPAKNLGAYGDGGMLVTSDKRVDESLRILRNYGQREKYHHGLRGYNRRLDTLQAAVLRTKLKYLDDWNAARRRHVAQYNLLLGENPSKVVTPVQREYAEPVCHLYVIQVNDRDGLQARLNDQGISSGIHYPVPIHLQPAYQGLGYGRGDFPIAEKQAQRILSLPMYPELASDAIERVAAAIGEFVSNGVVKSVLFADVR